MRVTVSYKGEKKTKMWIVHLPSGKTRGFPAHLYTREEAMRRAGSLED